jgi:FkbM family methyltransferase
VTVRATRRLRNLAAHLRRLADDERIRSLAMTYGELDYPRANVRLRLTSRQEFHRLRSCEKEPWTVRWIENHLRPGEVLYDVGANVGAYTLLAAVTVPTAQVVSFEPGPANFAALCSNVELNEVGEQVIAVPLALGDRARPARLHGDGTVPGASPSLDSAADATATALVDRLDDVVDRYELPAPDHLKLDVDGHELEVLAGGERVLGSVRSAMVELDRERGEQVVARLRDLGFELVERSSGRDRAPTAPTYGLFARAALSE